MITASGLGIITKTPRIRYRTNHETGEEYPVLQLRIKSRRNPRDIPPIHDSINAIFVGERAWEYQRFLKKGHWIQFYGEFRSRMIVVKGANRFKRVEGKLTPQPVYFPYFWLSLWKVDPAPKNVRNRPQPMWEG